MKRLLLLVGCLLLACLGALTLLGQAPPRTLGDPVRSAFLWSPLSGVEARIENGFFAVFQFQEAGSGKLRLVVYNRSGALERAVDLLSLVPDAAGMTPRSVSISKQGLVVASVGALRADGTASSVVIVLNSSATPARIIRTEPFAAAQIALSPDGYLFCFGRDGLAERGSVDYPMIRKYGLDGRLVGQSVMRSTFPRRSDPANHGGGKGGLTSLRASQAGVGAYVASTREWIDLDSAGNVVLRWRPKLPFGASEVTVQGLAFTDSGSVYASLLTYPGRFTLCRLDRSTGAWEPVSGADYVYGGPQPRPVAWMLLGADGDQLVFKGPNGQMLWFKEP